MKKFFRGIELNAGTSIAVAVGFCLVVVAPWVLIAHQWMKGKGINPEELADHQNPAVWVGILTTILFWVWVLWISGRNKRKNTQENLMKHRA